LPSFPPFPIIHWKPDASKQYGRASAEYRRWNLACGGPLIDAMCRRWRVLRAFREGCGLVRCSSLECMYVANERKKVNHGRWSKKVRRYCRFGNSIGMRLLWHFCVTNHDCWFETKLNPCFRGSFTLSQLSKNENIHMTKRSMLTVSTLYQRAFEILPTSYKSASLYYTSWEGKVTSIRFDKGTLHHI